VSSPLERLTELGLSLPAVPAPLAAYVPAVRSGGWVFTSGQLPLVDGQLKAVGRVGAEVSVEEAADCARLAALNAVAAVAAELGGLDQVARVVKVVVFVASAADFTGHPKVGNGASELLAHVFGEAGRHARSAVGCSSLPMNSPVEVELIVEASARPSIRPLTAQA
jgi:enamine deaminase RidA (YjgF/YER057c/UK114 family)